MSRPRLRDESGQVLALLAAGLLALLLGFVGVVVDVAAWYRAQRHAQAVADASALAAVRALPGSPARAAALARAYAARNGGAIDPPSFAGARLADDTVTVEAREQAPVYFARLFGIGAPTVHATATAAVAAQAEVADVVPLAVPASTRELACGAPCYGQATTLDFDRIAAAGGAFGFLDLSDRNGNVPPATLAGWIASGFPGEVGPGAYSSPGNRWNVPSVAAAVAGLAARHAVVLVPVYTGVTGNGANAVFSIGSFAAFRVDAFDDRSNALTGVFVRALVPSGPLPGQDAPYYDVSETRLVG